MPDYNMQILHVPPHEVGNLFELRKVQEQIDVGWELIAVNPSYCYDGGVLLWVGNDYYYRRVKDA